MQVLLGRGWKRRVLMDVETGGVTWFEEELVCCFKLAANVVRGGVWQFVYDTNRPASLVGLDLNANWEVWVWYCGSVIIEGWKLLLSCLSTLCGPNDVNHMNGQCFTTTASNSELPVTIYTQSHQIPFQEYWSVSVIHKLPNSTPDHIRHQFETTYQLILQSHHNHDLNIR